MSIEELNLKLSALDIPVAYRVFEEAQQPPYAVYYRDYDDTVSADNITYTKSPHIVLEVYTVCRNFELEKIIENLLTENDISYEVSETYIPEENLWETIYKFNL